MKSFSGFVPDEISDRYRAEMLDLLGGNSALMQQVERVENDYLFFVEQATDSVESDKGIHNDLVKLAEAVELIQSIYNPGGTARCLFEGEAFVLLGGAPVQQMRDLFSGVTGEGLAMAAQRALEKHKVPEQGGRPPGAAEAERRRLVETVASISELSGIKPMEQDRSGKATPFERLLHFVFKRLDIKIKPASAITELRKSQR